MMTGDRYCLLDSGTWEIRENKDGAEARPQGWYKVSEKQLYLQPREAAEQNVNAAITAELREKDRFVIPDPLDENQALLFIRSDVLTVPAADGVAGKWKITQKDPESGETRVAPYHLVLKKDGTYTVEQPGKELPAEWAKGSFSISDGLIRLKNEFTGEGLWQSPEFFLLDGKLRYNNRKYCVWCEKVREKKPEKTEAKKPEKKKAGDAAAKESSSP